MKKSPISSIKRARKPLRLPKTAMLTKNLQFKILQRVVKKVPQEFTIKMLGRRADRVKQEVRNQNQESQLMSRVELEEQEEAWL